MQSFLDWCLIRSDHRYRYRYWYKCYRYCYRYIWMWVVINTVQFMIFYHIINIFHITKVNFFYCSEWLAVPFSILFLYVDLKRNFWPTNFSHGDTCLLESTVYRSFFPKQMQNNCRDNVHCAGLEFKTLTVIWKGMVGDAFCSFCKSWARISPVMEAGQCHHCCCSQLSSFLCGKIYVTTLLPVCHTAQTIMWIRSCHGVPTFFSAFHIHETRFC